MGLLTGSCHESWLDVKAIPIKMCMHVAQRGLPDCLCQATPSLWGTMSRRYKESKGKHSALNDKLSQCSIKSSAICMQCASMF